MVEMKNPSETTTDIEWDTLILSHRVKRSLVQLTFAYNSISKETMSWSSEMLKDLQNPL